MEPNYLLGGVFLLGGFGAVSFGLLQAHKARKASQTWSTVEGKILESYVQVHRATSSKGATSYSPEVSYLYTVNGLAYTGNNFAFGSGGYSLKKADEIIATHHAGMKTTVHYDPADPAKAVLETTATGTVGALVVGGLLIFFGILAITGNMSYGMR